MANRERLIVTLVVLVAGLMFGGCGPSYIESFTQFNEAVREGNFDKMESILAKKPQLLNDDEDLSTKTTPLGIAAASGNKEVVEFLIAKGADINDRNRIRMGCRRATPLYSAATGGHKEIVELLIAKGADVNARYHTRQTPLTRAEEKGHNEVAAILREQSKAVEYIFNAVKQGDLAKVKSMLQEKLELLQNTSDDYTLLHQAAIDGHKEIAEFLIAKGASIDAKNFSRDAPLHSAVEAGHKDLVALLLTKGADVNSRANGDYTPLHIATRSQNVEMVEFLISKGANVNLRGSGGYPTSATSPLDIAIEMGYVNIAKILIAKGANVNSGNYDGWTALFFAAEEGNKEIADLLIANGADVNAKEKKEYGIARDADTGKMVRFLETDCWSPLHVAARQGHKETVEVLIANGAKVNARGVDNLTPLHIAAEHDHKEIVQVLLENGAKVNAETREREHIGQNYAAGTTPLHLAADSIHSEIVELLLSNGANVNAKDKDGYTPLDLAATHKIAELIIAKGAKVNRKDKWDPEIVHEARIGNLDRVKAILAENPNLANAKDEDGNSPLHWATGRGHKDIVELLLENGADVNATGPQLWLFYVLPEGQTGKKAEEDYWSAWKKKASYTSLHLAARKNYNEIAEILITNGADVNAKDDDGYTPLHRAAYLGHKEVVQLLIAKGADVNAKDDEGRTPLDLAIKKEHKDLADLLKKHGAVE